MVTTQVLLVLATATDVVISDLASMSLGLVVWLVIVAVIIPLYAAILCWLKGFPRTALVTTSLVILLLGTVALRKAFLIFTSGTALGS